MDNYVRSTSKSIIIWHQTSKNLKGKTFYMTFDVSNDLINELSCEIEYHFDFRFYKNEFLDFSFAAPCYICTQGETTWNNSQDRGRSYYPEFPSHDPPFRGPPSGTPLPAIGNHSGASDNKIIQGDLTETKWLLDNHTTRSYVRSPNYQRNSAIYQKRSYDGMKKLESFQSHHQ